MNFNKATNHMLYPIKAERSAVNEHNRAFGSVYNT